MLGWLLLTTDAGAPAGPKVRESKICDSDHSMYHDRSGMKAEVELPQIGPRLDPSLGMHID